MIFRIEAKKNLYIAEWNTTVINDLEKNIAVDLGHTELMVKTIEIKDVTGVPKAFRDE